MTRDGASEAARGIANRLGLPAWIYEDQKYKAENPACHSLWQVACMEWEALGERTQENVVAVVLPDGREFVEQGNER